MLTVENIIKSKYYNDIILTDKQRYQMQRLFDFMNADNQKTFKQQTVLKYLPDMMKAGVDSSLLERIKRKAKIKNSVTLYRCVLMYGKVEGKKRYEDYCEKQRITNTYEYKKKKYNMSREEFESYNKSRAITLKTMTLKYGKVEGKKRYEDYCEKQRYAGVTKEYFIEKLGKEAGVKKWMEVNKSKAINYDNLMKRFDNDKEKVDEYLQNLKIHNFFSKKSQDLFNALEKLIEHGKLHYATKNSEFGVIDTENKCYYRYDFVDTVNKICIEFDGDHFHGNPKFYSPDDNLKGRGCTLITAREKWEMDTIKANAIKARGFKVYRVWENDWDTNPKKVIEDIMNAYYRT